MRLLIFIAFLILSPPSHAQDDWRVRRSILEASDLIPNNGAEDVAINLLQKELSNGFPTDGGEEYGDYLAHLVSRVSMTRSRTSEVLLLNPNIINSGAIAISGLGRMRKGVSNVIISRLNLTRESSTLQSLVMALSENVNYYDYSDTEKDDMIDKLLHIELYNDYFVKRSYIDLLFALHTLKARERIEVLSLSDPFSVVSSNRKTYPAREYALQTLLAWR